jgi:hypothetical protein
VNYSRPRRGRSLRPGAGDSWKGYDRKTVQKYLLLVRERVFGSSGRTRT